MRTPFLAITAVLALSAAPAQAQIVFNNAERQTADAGYFPGSSPVAAITVSSTQFLNQIGVSLDPSGDGNLKFVVFNLDTQDLLFSTDPVPFVDAGSGFYLSPTFTPVTLSPGINYGIGAIADVSARWGFNALSSGNPYTQGGFTASDDRNGNTNSYSPPALAAVGDGAAMIIVQLGVAPVPEPGSTALLLAGLTSLRPSARAPVRKSLQTTPGPPEKVNRRLNRRHLLATAYHPSLKAGRRRPIPRAETKPPEPDLNTTATARSTPPSKLFTTANPHALATILEASETRRIIASRDIFDLNGIKLWARDQPVSGALQRKLLDRQLRNPLETCLMAEDGVTALQLVKATEALVAADGPLAAWVRPHAERLAKEAAQIPLHSVVQLLLTAAQASRPEAWQHALDAMVLAGALMAAHGGTGPEVRMAMLAGLTHDLGEVYIDPRYGEADAERTLDFTSYQQLVVHPHVGQLLLSQLTNYPASLARAVGEHHERCDGSGYPHALRKDAISPLGRLLAVTEAALGVLRSARPQLARVSVALRVVPGEFDLAWVGRIGEAVATQPPLEGRLELADVQARLTRLDAALQVAQQTTMALQPVAQTQPLKEALNLVQHLLGRLRAGWYASGLWSADAVAAPDAAEVEAVEDELFFRLQSIGRAARLCAGVLQPADAGRLDQLCDALVAIPG